MLAQGTDSAANHDVCEGVAFNAQPRVTRSPEHLYTERLVLRRPRASDAESILSRFAADPEVTRYLSWPTHRSVTDTRAFLAFSDAEWAKWPAGPYLIADRRDLKILGSTGLTFETPLRAATGYVLAQDSWGKGYATEALNAMVSLAGSAGVRRLQALCHADHDASSHVLEKCGFTREGILRKYCEFPNLDPVEPCDVLCYSVVL